MSNTETIEYIREVLESEELLEGPVDAIADDQDLYEVGLTSLTAVQLILAVEERLGFVFPDEVLNRESFHSIRTIAELVDSARASEASGIPSA